MLNKSGFGWNDSKKCVEVDSDEAWTAYVQVQFLIIILIIIIFYACFFSSYNNVFSLYIYRAIEVRKDGEIDLSLPMKDLSIYLGKIEQLGLEHKHQLTWLKI